MDPASCPAGRRCDLDTTLTALSGVYLGQVAVVLLSVLVVTAEYDTMMIRATLAATPNRAAVLAAKLAVVTAAVLPAAALSVLGPLLVGRLWLPGRGFTPAAGYPPMSLAQWPTGRAFLGSVLYLGLLALFSVGVAVTVRRSAAAISTMLGLLLVPAIIAGLMSDEHWRDRLQELAPMTAGLSIQATKHLDTLPIGPWAGLGVLAGYAAGAIVLGTVLFLRRDA
jgi:ABC-2 type transport system permease protein